MRYLIMLALCFITGCASCSEEPIKEEQFGPGPNGIR